MLASGTVKVAAIQAAPVLFDKAASTRKACELIARAASAGARLAALGESWISGYPFFTFSSPGEAAHWAAITEFFQNAIAIPGPETDLLCATAKDANIDVIIGATELDTKTSGSLYCTLLFIGRHGDIIGRHRKLKPTHAERAIWADGDAVGLRVYQRDYARISGLNCWEHAMVLPGYALMAGGTQIHVSAWPGTEHYTPPDSQILVSKMHLLSRAFAAQSASYVIAVGGLRRTEDIPERYRHINKLWPTNGDSCIIDPRGEIVAGPAVGETILYADIPMDLVVASKAACDVSGHYSRPDIFHFSVNTSEQKRISEST